MAAENIMGRAQVAQPAGAKTAGATAKSSAPPPPNGKDPGGPVAAAGAVPKLVSPSLANDSSGRRLSGAAMTSLAVHGAAAAALFVGFASGPSAPPPAAMIIEMAPLPSAPPVPPSEMPPQPEQEEAKPEPVVSKIELPPIPKLAFNVKPTVTVPLKELADPNKKQAEKPADETTRAAAPSAPKDDKPAAPSFGSPSNVPSNAEMNWEARVLAALERRKRYPAAAQSAGQEDVVYVRITMDRNGRVTNSQIRKSRGFAMLNAEVAALVKRASPLPKPPKEVTGTTISLLVPVEFFIKR